MEEEKKKPKKIVGRRRANEEPRPPASITVTPYRPEDKRERPPGPVTRKWPRGYTPLFEENLPAQQEPQVPGTQITRQVLMTEEGPHQIVYSVPAQTPDRPQAKRGPPTKREAQKKKKKKEEEKEAKREESVQIISPQVLSQQPQIQTQSQHFDFGEPSADQEELSHLEDTAKRAEDLKKADEARKKLFADNAKRLRKKKIEEEQQSLPPPATERKSAVVIPQAPATDVPLQQRKLIRVVRRKEQKEAEKREKDAKKLAAEYAKRQRLKKKAEKEEQKTYTQPRLEAPELAPVYGLSQAQEAEQVDISAIGSVPIVAPPMPLSQQSHPSFGSSLMPFVDERKEDEGSQVYVPPGEEEKKEGGLTAEQARQRRYGLSEYYKEYGTPVYDAEEFEGNYEQYIANLPEEDKPVMPQEYELPPMLAPPYTQQPFRPASGADTRPPEQPVPSTRKVQQYSRRAEENWRSLQALSALVKRQVKARIESLTGDDAIIGKLWGNAFSIKTTPAHGISIDMARLSLSEFLNPDYAQLPLLVLEVMNVVLHKKIKMEESGGLAVKFILYLDKSDGHNTGLVVQNYSFFKGVSEDAPEVLITERKKQAMEALTTLIPVLKSYNDMALATAKYNTSASENFEDLAELADVEYINMKTGASVKGTRLYISKVFITPVSYTEGVAGRKSALLSQHGLLRKFYPYLYRGTERTYNDGMNPILSAYLDLTGQQLGAHMVTFKSAVSKIKNYVMFSGLTEEGICFYEAVYASMLLNADDVQACMIISKARGWRKEIQSWKSRVLSSFLALNEVEKEVFIDGNAVSYINLELSNKYGVGVYQFALGRLYGPPSKWIAVIYGGHAYSTLYEVIAGASLPKIKGGKNYAQLTNRAYSLKATERGKEKKEPTHTHYVYDFETLDSGYGVQVPYLMIIRTIGSKEEPVVFYGLGCEYDFVFSFLMPLISRVRDEKHSYYHFWAYNGSNFDIHFIVKVLTHILPLEITGSHLSIKKLKIGNCIEFLDLAAWYTSVYDKKTGRRGLDALAESCHSPIKKLPFKHAGITPETLKSNEFKAESIKYCTQDCDVLAWLVQKLVIDALDEFEYEGEKIGSLKLYPCSAASLAKKFFEYFFCNDIVYGTPEPQRLRKERISYKGGLTLALKPLAENLRCYDINSSYPAVMCEEMPAFFLGWCNKDSKQEISEKEVPTTWLYGVVKFEFPRVTKLPSLMIRGRNGIILPLRWESESPEYFWGCEINQALKLGAKIWASEEIQYKGIPIFRTFVNCFYTKRLEAKKKGQAHMVLFYKILMNSLQGKLGQRDFGECDIGSMGALRQAVATVADTYNLKVVGEGVFKVKYQEEELAKCKKIGALVRFPSYIAARGRCKLHEAAQTVIGDVAYMDTDSIFLANGNTLDSKFCSENELGKFKEEKEKASEFGVFFGAKNYCLYKAGDVNIACKGSRFDFNTEYKKFIEDYKAQLDDPEKIAFIKSTKLPLFAKKFGRVQVLENWKAVKPTFRLKRIPIGRFDSQPFETVEEANKQEQVVIKRQTEIKIKYIEAQICKDAEIEAKKAVKGIFIDTDLKPRRIRTDVEECVFGLEEEKEKIREGLKNPAIDPELREEAEAQLDCWGPREWENAIEDANALDDIAYLSSVN